MKQYFLKYDSDRYDSKEYDIAKGGYGSYSHTYGTNASTIKIAKAYIRKMRKELANENPRNFRIYDSAGDIDPITNYVPCVYQED